MPVPSAENAAMKAAAMTGTTIAYCDQSRLHVVLFGQAKDQATYNHDGYWFDTNVLHILFSVKVNRESAQKLLEHMADCDTKYAGQTYIVFISGYGAAKLRVLPMYDWSITDLRTYMNSGINYRRKVSILYGTGYSLVETFVDLQDLIALPYKNAVTIRGVGRTDRIMTHIVTADCGFNAHTMRSSRGLAGTDRLDKYIKRIPEGSRIYVFSSQDGALAPRIFAPHLELLSNLITPEQVAIYVGGAPDDTAVTYDDADSDHDVYAD